MIIEFPGPVFSERKGPLQSSTLWIPASTGQDSLCRAICSHGFRELPVQRSADPMTLPERAHRAGRAQALFSTP